MKILDINKAQLHFEERAELHYSQCEELAEKLSTAIAATTADSVNSWDILGAPTKRVAYVHVGDYLPETVATVSNAFKDAGYVCNHIVVEALDGCPSVNMLAVIWDEGCTTMVDLYLTWLHETQAEGGEADADAAEFEGATPDGEVDTDVPEGDGPEVDAGADADPQSVEGAFPAFSQEGGFTRVDPLPGDSFNYQA